MCLRAQSHGIRCNEMTTQLLADRKAIYLFPELQKKDDDVCVEHSVLDRSNEYHEKRAGQQMVTTPRYQSRVIWSTLF